MNKETGKKRIEKIISSIKKISSLPTVFSRVNELLNDPTSCAADFGKVISQDQALTARLLRLVNSAFYGFPSRIDTVTKAITIIGFRQLKDLVLATSVLDVFSGAGEDNSFSMDDFWRHSLACGVASRVLAIYKREKENQETYFVAGLLHDIGRLVLLESCSEQYREVFMITKKENKLMYEAEEEVFGFTHALVGKELLSLWKLPPFLKDSVCFHHDPNGGGGSSSYVDVVHIANILVHASELGFSGDQFVPPLSQEAWKRVGLKKSVLEPAMEKIYEQFKEAVAFLLVKEQKNSDIV